MKKTFSLKYIITAVAALVGAICAFLPWATISATVLTVTTTDSQNGILTESPINGLGWVTFVLFLAVIGISAFFSMKKEVPAAAKISISVAGAAALIIAIVEIIRINGALAESIPSYMAKYASAGAGFGLFIMIAFAVIVAALPWIPFDKRIGSEN